MTAYLRRMPETTNAIGIRVPTLVKLRLRPFAACVLLFALQGAYAQDQPRQSQPTGNPPVKDHVGNSFGGKASLEIVQRYDGPEKLPMPAQVVVEDFTNTGPIVRDKKRSIDPSAARLEARLHPDIPSDELVKQIQDSFANALTTQFKKMNVESTRVSDASSVIGPAIIVQGDFTLIAPGNPSKRILVGFGRGASDLKTHITISEVANGQKTVLLEFNVNSQSGKHPGALMSTSATGLAVGIALNRMGDRKSGTVQADAARMAKLTGMQAKSIMDVSQWIAKPPTN